MLKVLVSCCRVSIQQQARDPLAFWSEPVQECGCRAAEKWPAATRLSALVQSEQASACAFSSSSSWTTQERAPASTEHGLPTLGERVSVHTRAASAAARARAGVDSDLNNTDTYKINNESIKFHLHVLYSSYCLDE